MKRSLLTVLAIFLSGIIILPAADESDKKHPLDVKVEKLSDEAKSTADSTGAYTKGLELWDREMNRVYQEMKKVLPEKSFAALKASQVQWLAYRDAQIAFINSCYDQYEGTMFQPMRASAIMEVTRARALDLGKRLEMHKEHAAEQ
jgi:uncharacterized protein YecT (DUF1311 family)